MDRHSLEMLVIIVGPAGLALIVTCILILWRPEWTNRRRTLWSSVPLPAAMLAFCAFLFAKAAVAPEKSCGVDACAMAMMVSSVLALWAAAALLLGAVLSAGLQKFLGPRQ